MRLILLFFLDPIQNSPALDANNDHHGWLTTNRSRSLATMEPMATCYAGFGSITSWGWSQRKKRSTKRLHSPSLNAVSMDITQRFWRTVRLGQAKRGQSAILTRYVKYVSSRVCVYTPSVMVLLCKCYRNCLNVCLAFMLSCSLWLFCDRIFIVSFFLSNSKERTLWFFHGICLVWTVVVSALL